MSKKPEYTTVDLINDLKLRDDAVCCLAAQRLEKQAHMLFLFREFYSFYVTQSKIGSSHHHPIWGDIACILDSAGLNHKALSVEDYQYISAPYYNYYEVRIKNEELYKEEE